jgi:hypothetical protein
MREKADPGASYYPLHDIEILEGQNNPIERSVMKNNVVKKGNRENYVQPGASSDALEKSRF